MAENKKRERKRVDPRTTVQYYSMYQNFGDVLSMCGVCFLVLLVALAILAMIYLLIMSPHPTINMFYIIEQAAIWAMKTFLHILKYLLEAASRFVAA